MTQFDNVLPKDIESRSMQIITHELGNTVLDEINAPVIKRVIHTTADFSYVDSLCFSKDAVKIAIDAIKSGACIVTDTNMARAGVNKKSLAKYGGEVFCFMADDDVAQEAKNRGTTRATICMEKAAKLGKPIIIAIGNAPTALISLSEMIKQNIIAPKLIIGVPVGFVNVVQAKELIMTHDVPYIVSRGRKGGSNVAAAICNAIIYKAIDRKLD